MSTRQKLIDASTKHQVFLQRYGGTVYRQMFIFIEQAKEKTTQLLQQYGTALSKVRYTQLLQELTALNKELYSNMNKSIKQQALNLAEYEAAFTQRMLKSASDVPFETNVPTLQQLKSAAFTTVMDARPGWKGTEGLTVGQALSDFSAKKAGDIVNTVRVGFALGQTSEEIAKGISSLTDGLIRRQAETLARTITNHVAAQSRMEFYRENKDVVSKFQVVATLDDRTTEECAALDGQVFTEEDFSEPPYHWNCRSTFIAVIDSQYDAGSEVTGTRPAQTEDGYTQVSTQTTYNSWIKSQPATFQNEVLGKTKAELLRAGANVQQFVDENYSPLSIAELRAKDDMHIFFDKAEI